MRLSRIDPELFSALAARFRRSVLALESRGASWFDYHSLGVELYEHSEALWQVYGKGRRLGEQRTYLMFAILVFEQAIRTAKVMPEGYTERQARIDVAICMTAVARVSVLRLWTDAAAAREQSAKIIMAATGGNEKTGLVDRWTTDYPERLQHYAAIICTAGFQLACGDMFGYLQPINQQKVASFLSRALALFTKESIDSLDQEYTYRRLLLLAAMKAQADGDSTARRLYARLAYQSALRYGHSEHARHARLIDYFGQSGNRLAYGLYLML